MSEHQQSSPPRCWKIIHDSLRASSKLPMPDPESSREYLLRFGKTIHAARGSKLTIGCLYLMLEGVVALTAVSATGERHSLIYFEQGDLLNFIPSVAHAYSIPHDMYDALLYHESLAMYAKTDCRLIRVELKDALQHIHEASLNALLVRGLAKNLMMVIAQSVNNCTLSATARLCRMLSVFMEKNPPHRLPRYLTHAEIAGHLAMHEMTVAKIFHSLRKEGVLRRENGVNSVNDPSLLMRLASQECQLAYDKE